MSASRSVHVVLDIQPTDGTISGQLAVDAAHVAHFHGWLELIDRIESAVIQGQTESTIAIVSPEGSPCEQ